MKRSRRKAPRVSFKQSYLLIILIIVAIGSAILSGYTGWGLYGGWFVSINALTFGLYGFDKSQAQRNGRRTPEIVLHTVALLGGFLGGWLGRWMFRHKTRKGIFTLILALSTLLHLALYYFVFRV